MKSDTMKPTKDKSKFTSGPWVYAFGAIYQGDNADTVEENCGRLLQADRDNPHTMPTERDANCRLAALAPAMLETLETLYAMGEHQRTVGSNNEVSMVGNAYAKARAVIARAKGESTT